ncbi:MAG: 3-isopropylmalate/(R)-2-methylmalate dehydratase small subunit, partial [Planctomycetota bacterium]
MPPTPFERVRSRYVTLDDANIDTDQIIPARFLTTTKSTGLGAHAFADWRSRSGSPLNDERATGAQILVTGDNFGCGSSREHAP